MLVLPQSVVSFLSEVRRCSFTSVRKSVTEHKWHLTEADRTTTTKGVGKERSYGSYDEV